LRTVQWRMPRSRRVIALGGGGFTMEETPLLDDHVLASAGVDRPRVLFVPTASGDSPGYVAHFHDVFADRAETAHLPLFARVDADLRAVVFAHDIVYVGGGNTANMVAVWRIHGLDTVLREAHERGVILAGVSAGALCWFSGGVTDSFGLPLRRFDLGLGVLPEAMVPHYDSEGSRRPTLHAMVGRGELPATLAVEDGAALDFVDGTLAEVVTSRPGARVYRVARDGDAVRETVLPARFLGETPAR
jgi:dipeptidase E